MRKLILNLVGAAYILIALVNLVPGASGQFFSANKGYNIFLALMGLLALGAADQGGDFARAYDYIFSLLLITMAGVGAVSLVHYGTGHLGNIIFDSASAFALLYVGLVLNHQLKQSQK